MAFVIHKSKAPAAPKVVLRSSKAAKERYAESAADQSTAPASLGVSNPLERYRLDCVIGEGGTGQVLKAYDQLLEMDVAIKILAPCLVNDPEALQALKAEARITLSLIHNHILRIYNLERSGDKYLLIMEYLSGKTIGELLLENPSGFEPNFVASAITVIADAIGYAHRHGVLHKDLTPSNIFFTDDGVIKVIDFGLASVVGASSMVGDDSIIGTPAYMSPEQLRGEVLDVGSDIYSAGVLAYQMLTGHVIAPDATIEDMAFRPHEPIADITPGVASVINTATAFSPADRYSAIGEFAAALSSAISSL
jgi:serine/threonine-protein kinase